MKTDELIEKNRELQQQLTAENEKYYGDLVVYLRAKGMFKSDQQIEEKALEILQDILEAQSEGVTAEEYFGKQPQEIVDDLVEFTSPSLVDFLKVLLYALGIYSVCSLFPALVFPDKPLDLGTFGLVAAYSLGAALLLCWLIGTSVYKRKSSNVINGIIFGVLLAGGIALSVIIKTPFQVKIVGVWGILLILILLTTAGNLFLRQSKDEKLMWAPFVPIITTCALIGILSRISSISRFFETTTGKYIVAGILIITFIVQWLLFYLYSKKLKAEAS